MSLGREIIWTVLSPCRSSLLKVKQIKLIISQHHKACSEFTPLSAADVGECIEFWDGFQSTYGGLSVFLACAFCYVPQVWQTLGTTRHCLQVVGSGVTTLHVVVIMWQLYIVVTTWPLHIVDNHVTPAHSRQSRDVQTVDSGVTTVKSRVTGEVTVPLPQLLVFSVSEAMAATHHVASWGAAGVSWRCP